ncbi:MAG: MerR family transcriptional regulator [Burkholderiales bacterium]|nr:MerR family transcriptional regulator [Burkholderiales bacterium]
MSPPGRPKGEYRRPQAEGTPVSGKAWIVQADIGEPGLTLEELCRACAVPAAWVDQRVRAGLLAPRIEADAPAASWRFDAALLVRLRVMHRIECDFDAVPELAALVADLQDEIRRLRLRLGGGG